jgi:BNR repeat protein
MRAPVRGEVIDVRRAVRIPGLLTLMVMGFVVTSLVPAHVVGATPSSPSELGYCGGDDWEPSLAAAEGGRIYVLITHYAGDTTCDPADGLHGSRIMIQVSTDDGATFSAPRVVANRPGGIAYPKQADPAIAVDPASGDVYASFLTYGLSGGHTDVYVAKSTDHGQSFHAAKVNSHDCKNCDHPKLLVDGQNVYVAYSQATNHYISVSTDGGDSFTETDVLRTGVVGFAEGGVLDSHGNAWFAWGDCRSSSCKGTPAVDYRISKTRAGTSRTSFTEVATGDQGPPCPFSKCGFSFFGPQDDIGIDASGTLYLVWQQGQDSAVRGSPPIIDLSRCSAHCTSASSWSFVGRVDDKNASGCAGSRCYALFPTIVGGAGGEIHVTWFDDRNGGPIDHVNGWNVWYRTSTDGGDAWTSPGQRMSAYMPTEPQSGPNGFLFPYGDYMRVELDPSCGGEPVMVWGEGRNWVGGPSAPGHINFRSLC